MSAEQGPRSSRGFRRLFSIPSSSRTIARDVADEIRFHIDSRAAELRAAGLGDAAAKEQAEREYGEVSASHRELATVDQRRLRKHQRTEAWSGLRYDLGHVVRSLRKQPGFSLGVVVILALGIGANATMFGIADQLLFRPPAYLADGSRTGRAYFSDVFRGEPFTFTSLSYPTFADMRNGTTSFSTVAAHFSAKLVVGTGGDATELVVTGASASYWNIFTAHPYIGRFFSADDDRLPSGEPVAVLGYGTWRARFGGDAGVLGRRIRIGAREYTIIGVTPPGFTGMDLTSAAAYVPITAIGADVAGPAFATRRFTTWLEVVTVRRPVVSAAVADDDLSRAFNISAGSDRKAGTALPRATIGPVIENRGPLAGSAAKVSQWLLAVSIAVVLIACANTANLLLARAVSRRREHAVRVALGAGWWRIGRSVFAESVLLALIGAGAGLVVSYWARGVLERILIPDAIGPDASLLDARTVLFTAAVALCTGLLAGIVPLRQIARRDVMAVLKTGDRSGSASRSGIRALLVVGQIALSVVLLVGAGLFVRSFRTARALDLGYDAQELLIVSADLRSAGIDKDVDDDRVRRMLFERARGLAGVSNAAVATTVPFFRNSFDGISVPGRDSLPHQGKYAIDAVSGDYFRAMGTKIVRGRGLRDSDSFGAPLVAVVSESMARDLWPNANPLGQCIKLGRDTMPCREVVGVAQDVRRGDIGAELRLQYYLPIMQYGRQPSFAYSTLILRVRAPASTSAEEIRRVLQRAAPPLAFMSIIPLQSRVDRQMQSWKLGATMLTLFASLAVILVAVGLLGVMGYDVVQRMREFGIRMALGGTRSHVFGLIVSRAFVLTAFGVAAGIVLTLLTARRAEGLLFRTSTHDPATFGAVIVVLFAVGMVAALLPARRATSANVARVLREE